ncbi:MAG TPA: hypothetical protein VGK73_15135 [Polyangiaceae bacterium]
MKRQPRPRAPVVLLTLSRLAELQRPRAFAIHVEVQQLFREAQKLGK